ncbi:hypothetical protein J4E81_000646 [Alternaria sp. BMP 2799]|uniref:uncharacterized protein n=1 Tax=Alternaria triticimaculans TaxID=297637 RepID=UPI0020C299C2|nr:uncharacterized protein J4E78_000294 [Alternaria triticimaculans]XP_051357229.1 uncharacterized protein J4E92_000298 [Alternaria infectoria]KAI4671798.1 hypothetical protein J4E78_000294 [Alternaria triticimaculans]KAI4705761.1 hypothetical protein J4E81_000646 [Alternaria sp. BMP 2799]KAI4939017.1 hypothetical protein J4E92_000298 [Alternaria infectoria]
MKFSTSFVGAAVLLASTVYAAEAPAVTTTLTAKAGCPSAAPADVMVTRSAVAVPSCAAGANETKPSIVTMPGYGTGMMGSATGTGMMPEFTGAASANMISGVVVGVFGGLAAALMV